MLKNDLFTFTDLQEEGNIVRTIIGLNASHPIFAGHFPGQPVLPGACMMQMVKEVLADYLGKPIKLVSASDLKFLAVVDPAENNPIQMEIKLVREDGRTRIDAKLLDNAIILFKFKGIFVPI
jgi:3-hydroxyacyl-[acyl-carrier-protein] dehydratase